MRRLLLILGALALAVPASAQTPIAVTADSGIEFTASPHHDTILADGTSQLMAYEARFNTLATSSGCQPLTPQSLGKPTPGITGVILIDPWVFLGSVPASCVYTTYIVAIGQQGVEGPPSPVSDPFVRVLRTPPGAAGRPVIRP